MKFKVRGEGVVLKGDASLTRSMVSLKAMMRTIRHERNGIYLELSSLSVEGSGSKVVEGCFYESMLPFLIRQRGCLLIG